jgi:hypothetical protein
MGVFGTASRWRPGPRSARVTTSRPAGRSLGPHARDRDGWASTCTTRPWAPGPVNPPWPHCDGSQPDALRAKNTYLAAQHTRLRPRLGHAKALVAIEHSILVANFYSSSEISPTTTLGGLPHPPRRPRTTRPQAYPTAQGHRLLRAGGTTTTGRRIADQGPASPVVFSSDQQTRQAPSQSG